MPVEIAMLGEERPMANEVKRFYEVQGGGLEESSDGELVLYKDHDRIVAAKDAEIATLKKALDDSMAQVMVAVHGETNTGWPHEKKLHETIAEQKRVIEKLRDVCLQSHTQDCVDGWIEKARGAK